MGRTVLNRIAPHASHWGAFDAIVRDGRIVDVRPFATRPRSVADHLRRRRCSPCGEPHRSALCAQGLAERRSLRRHAARQRAVRAAGLGSRRHGWSRTNSRASDRRVARRACSAAAMAGRRPAGSIMRRRRCSACWRRPAASPNHRTCYSYGAAQVLLPHIVGDFACAVGPVADWRAIAQHAKLMLCFGGIALRNGQVTNGGGALHEMHHWLRNAAQAGVRLVNISPQRADMADDIACEWLPIRPGTDTALMLAMAFVLIAEDRVDRAFLDRCTVGFDRHCRVCARCDRWRAEDAGMGRERNRHRRRRDCCARARLRRGCRQC